MLPNHHLMSVTVAGPNVRNQVRTNSVRAWSGSTAVSGAPIQSEVSVQRGRELVQPLSLGPRTISPRTPSTVKTLGDSGVSPPQVFPGAGL
ncbi:hypothetical protein BN970_06556 [Mycolicibacterium conceptionense]|uniref:Uncharacterized protein n=1 Tax=Mycolicibacterium conceptionense TaxID=451644 RepID=A0A0U1DXJ9_9MYCO|nr:hypothetical protein BN970_06556 [Mycolicibacterium conceptionense]